MSNTITITFDEPRRKTFKLPLFTRDRSNTLFYCVLSDDCVIMVDDGRIEIGETPKSALRQGFVEIDEFDFREKLEQAQARISTCIDLIDTAKKASEPEIIESNGQLRHQ